MKQTLLICVECYSGYKANETPHRFKTEQKWIEVEKVVDRWYEIGSQPNQPRLEYFKVAAEDGHSYLLQYDSVSDEWYLESRG